MFIVESHGIIQKFDSEVDATCVFATLKTFGYSANLYKALKILI